MPATHTQAADLVPSHGRRVKSRATGQDGPFLAKRWLGPRVNLADRGLENPLTEGVIRALPTRKRG